jgi:hypothetical protein
MVDTGNAESSDKVFAAAKLLTSRSAGSSIPMHI